jgi:hypothetical protein
MLAQTGICWVLRSCLFQEAVYLLHLLDEPEEVVFNTSIRRSFHPGHNSALFCWRGAYSHSKLASSSAT